MIIPAIEIKQTRQMHTDNIYFHPDVKLEIQKNMIMNENLYIYVHTCLLLSFCQ